ncbi:MAG: sel1 repeat family protein [Bacilli bacterium]|nr:sel1 repeat family protein [Bacilli bacterium]MBN2877225.1 sel1 repeat family protein [Bacilli bacterium]
MADNILAKAIKDFSVKNYKDAFPVFKKLARTQTEAAYFLGLMYFYGYSVTPDDSQVFKHFKKAWEGLYPDAIYMLGVCYEEGRGTNQDLNQAFELYQAAAKSESQLALLKIAKFHEDGIVVKKNLKTAIEFYVKLSKYNNAYAMYKIGSFYLEGKGLKKSLDNAYMWLNKALAAGSVEAMNYFRLLGSKSKTDIRSTQDIYQAAKSHWNKQEYEPALQLLEIAAKENHVNAIFDLEEAYRLGIGCKQDLDAAFKILLKYKDLKNPELFMRIAKKYEEGEGIPSSYIKAAMFYELAAKLQYEPANQALLEIRGY